MSSLRAQLLAWVLVPVGCAVAINGWIAHDSAYERADARQDTLLAGAARIIAERVAVDEGQGDVPPAALELFQGDPQDAVWYRATDDRGRTLIGTAELPLPPSKLQPEHPVFFRASVRGRPVRIAAYLQPIMGEPADRRAVVEVAQTLVAHDGIARRFWTHGVLQQLGLLLLVTALILLGLRRGLRPVLELRDAVTRRPAGATEPLRHGNVPEEFMPLVDAINAYGRRLTHYTEAQRVFIQNAAHQLRTPFTLLQTQASFALRARDDQARHESLIAIRRTIHQSARLVNQLLVLSAAEARADGERRLDVVDLRPLVQEVLEDLAAAAEAKRIDLGLDEADADVRALGRRVALREIFMNLVDNAIRYTPAGGIVTVRLTRDTDRATVVVEDDGPGIPQAQREFVFERFARLSDSDSDGCGLGLAVVRELATALDARVELATATGGRGLSAIVRLAAAGDAAATRSAAVPAPAPPTSVDEEEMR